MQRLSQQEPLGLLVAVARRSIKQAVGHLVRGHGLSPQQFWFLVAIAEREGRPLVALGAWLRVDPPTASRVVATLVRRGLVRVEDDLEDRRHACLCLTARGRGLAVRVRPLAERVRAAVGAGLSAGEARALRSGLRKVIENMDRFKTDRVDR
jgi:DNA-binding MarR family transcriptional regulator